MANRLRRRCSMRPPSSGRTTPRRSSAVRCPDGSLAMDRNHKAEAAATYIRVEQSKLDPAFVLSVIDNKDVNFTTSLREPSNTPRSWPRSARSRTSQRAGRITLSRNFTTSREVERHDGAARDADASPDIALEAVRLTLDYQTDAGSYAPSRASTSGSIAASAWCCSVRRLRQILDPEGRGRLYLPSSVAFLSTARTSPDPAPTASWCSRNSTSCCLGRTSA